MQDVIADVRPGRQSVFVWSLILFVLLLAGILADAPVARWLHESGVAARADSWAGKAILKAPGEAWLILLVSGLVTWLHPLRWRAGGFIALACALSGLHVLLKWGVGRNRPYTFDDAAGPLAPLHFHWFRHGLPGLFQQVNLSFPSGHTSTAFALAASLAILFPRGRWIWFAVATLTGLQRISENAHFVSDVLAGAAFGVGVTYGVVWCITVLQLRATSRPRRSAEEAAP